MKARLATALVAAASLLLPAHSLAAAGPSGRQGGRGPRVAVKQLLASEGTNGYEVSVEVLDGRRLTLSASKLGSGLSVQAAEYSLRLRRKLPPEGIVAGLGRLGRIDVHFVPRTTKRAHTPHTCAGEKTVTEEGLYVGSIIFHGERGFTRVDLHRAAGAIVSEPVRSCSHPVGPVEQRRQDLIKKAAPKEAEEKEEEEGGGLETVSLHASSASPPVAFKASRLAVLKASGGSSYSVTNFVATAERRRGRIKEKSTAVALFSEGSAFRTPEPTDPKSELLVDPPAPFSGSATYRQETPTRSHWSGDLKVDMPGFGLIPLAGRRSEATAVLLRRAG